MSASTTDAATRAAWDAIAQQYGLLLPDMSAEAPLDRAVLAAYAEMLADDRSGTVADVGCGTGRVTRHLRDAGLQMVGLDLSPHMVAAARTAHPELPFAAAHAAALPVRSAVLRGLVAWYSIINTPTTSLPSTFSEFARVTRPGAPVLLAFQSGEGQVVERTTSYGLPVTLTYYRHSAEATADALIAAGFSLYASVTRAAALPFESTTQTVLLAHRNEL
ncbi:MAG TPA: class I SAM-dependent methyltransferase [Mycobacteriales bacterium]|jgi:ubiquinone/menaquinone biosynthesis C-methylase UbiE|nr:class I SAM-dependent methyltransferase [Mycobacteriales bacterium]HVX70903.1 class I SAM-dependent methyltransferase [Mycobacteriales bacterium]